MSTEGEKPRLLIEQMTVKHLQTPLKNTAQSVDSKKSMTTSHLAKPLNQGGDKGDSGKK